MCNLALSCALPWQNAFICKFYNNSKTRTKDSQVKDLHHGEVILPPSKLAINRDFICPKPHFGFRLQPAQGGEETKCWGIRPRGGMQINHSSFPLANARNTKP